MEMKGFITGSLVTLGVVGLVAALKDTDILVFDDDFDIDEEATDKVSDKMNFGGFADDDGSESKGTDKTEESVSVTEPDKEPMSDDEKKVKIIAMQEKLGKFGEELKSLLAELNGVA